MTIIISPILSPLHAHKLYSVVLALAITIIGICGHGLILKAHNNKRYNGRWWLQNQLDRFTTSGRGALAGLVEGSEEDSLGIYLFANTTAAGTQRWRDFLHFPPMTVSVLPSSVPTVQLSSFHFLSVWFYVVGLLLSHSLSICGWLWWRTQTISRAIRRPPTTTTIQELSRCVFYGFRYKSWVTSRGTFGWLYRG